MNGSAATPKDAPDAPLIFLIAGEPSSDALGAHLMAALRQATGGRVRFAGVGGDLMQDNGLHSLFPIKELSVLGVFEVLPRIVQLLRRMRETAAAVRDLAPTAVVSIDAPGFCFGVWRRLRGSGIPLIHYVAPTVWAWRPGRVRKFARYLDHLMVLLPFEPPYFERPGLGCTFVGHAVLESGAGEGDGAAFRTRHGIAPGDTLLCVLPGSRSGEVGRLVAPFGEALAILAERIDGLRVAVPTVPDLAEQVAERCRQWPVPAIVVTGTAEKYDAMAASQAALAASGTVALELALAGVPMVVAYRMNPLTYRLVVRMVRVKYVNMINLLLDRPVVPELLQARCRGDLLAAEVSRLLVDEAARRAQAEAVSEAVQMLRGPNMTPSECAAQTVLRVIAETQGTNALGANDLDAGRQPDGEP